MNDKVDLDTFPGNATEALAMLYVQNQDLHGVSPEQLQTMYYEAYFAIRKEYQRKVASGWFSAAKETD